MFINQYPKDDVVIIELEGRLDGDGAVQLDSTLAALCEGQQAKVVLDMAAVNYVNSSGLRVLARYLKISQAHGCQMRLCNLGENVSRALEMVGLYQFFQHYETLQAALAA
jgi:anti-anti-sigma factor